MTTMSILGAMAIAVSLASCASTGSEAGPDVTNAVGQRFAGRPVSEMLGRYGAPLRSMEVGGETVYSWEARDTLFFNTQPPLPVRCQLDAYVPASGVVRTVGVTGQMGACPKFLP